MSENLELLKSRNVLEMLTVAHEFCLFTEDVKNKSSQQMLEYYQKVLPLLYVKGSLLPDMDVEDTDSLERYITAEQWQETFQTLEEKLGKDDIFWILDPVQDSIKASLSDHIADIYQDMKDFVLLFQNPKNIAKENAVVECKFQFASHWGLRISRILNPIHQLLHSNETGTEEGVVF